ncbi:MAG: hypothetical protein LAT75_11670 [Candidatus Cyclonatronum sp.]|uniref:hypothetical protein n=1 Tax=Cyclonatronum sp. TaxID=3024185 RepID=UPI0025BA6C03|nr:hypothetical protein [Cyclonatronum sp.]MCC5935549.1 hypothetical protein [Balneolales bacterium]MCH8487516.1 hypothetical protein [Cyclonatronum sp.]
MIEIYLMILVVISLIVFKLKAGKDRRLFNIILLAFGLRLFVLIFEFYIYPGLPYLTAPDSERFHENGIEYAQYPLSYLLFPPYPSGSELYSYWLGIVYALLGFESDLLARAVNVFLGVLTIFNVYQINQILWGRTIALQNTLLMAIFPLLVIYSQDLLRESFVVYFLSLGIRHYCSWYRNSNWVNLVLAVTAIVLSAAFHVGALLSLVAIGLYNFWYAIRQIMSGQFVGLIKSIVAILVIGLGLAYINATGWGLSDLGGEGALQEFGVEELIERRGSGSAIEGRATYLQGLTATTPTDVILQTPIRLVYFALAPFPWMIRSAWDLVGLFDSLLYFLIILGIFRSWKVIKRDPLKVILVLMIIAMALTFTWGVTNYGTGMRHRAKIVILAISLAPHLWPIRKLYYNRYIKKYEVKLKRIKVAD